MRDELFPFQTLAVRELRMKIAMAVNNYRMTSVPQVISLQAPTGSGKTIIMASLVEDIFFGNEQFPEQPNAIFVWLSDSPLLNEQSKQKFELKADKLKFGQCITIDAESFDREELEDGYIYFLNTQKLTKSANLTKYSDGRQYTIWDTLENTARNKADRLYFIIDEAHRGMQGKEAGKATSIMQKFLKGSKVDGLSPMPVVIGVSATAERFTKLVGQTTSTLNYTIITADNVRASGLLKDLIIVNYLESENDMAVLQAATDEWREKCRHWYNYTYEQHYKNVNPVFVIQVENGTEGIISKTNLDDVIAKIEERLGERFKENEVVHTFGSTGDLIINGLKVPHVDPVEITDDRIIKVVLFKDNLSTGWDCPRAETMMSFRRANDATYIAQLLGRMVRTPLQMHIQVDEYLNDVRLFLPYFDKENVKKVVEELKNAEGGDIPTFIDGQDIDDVGYGTWTVKPRPRTPKTSTPDPNQFQFGENGQTFTTGTVDYPSDNGNGNNVGTTTPSIPPSTTTNPPSQPTVFVPTPQPAKPFATPEEVETGEQLEITFGFDREEVCKFINQKAYLTYDVRTARIHSYLKSLFDLASLLTQEDIYLNANNEIRDYIINSIHKYIENIKNAGLYEKQAKKVLEFKLLMDVFDVFGEEVKHSTQTSLFTSDSDLDRQVRAVESKICNYGLCNLYGKKYFDENDPNAYKIDFILYACDDDCISDLNAYAKKTFERFVDEYRLYIVGKSEQCKSQFDKISSNSDLVSKHNLALPESITVKEDADGKEYRNHLFANDEGVSKIKLNGWEEKVIEEESKRDDFVCWLRNPSRNGYLCLPYEMDNETKAMYPDFFIVRKDPILKYVVDVVEPHGSQFKDNLGKAKGLAKYCKEQSTQSGQFARVELVREITKYGETKLVRIDLAKTEIRNKVIKCIGNDELDHIFDTDGYSF